MAKEFSLSLIFFNYHKLLSIVYNLLLTAYNNYGIIKPKRKMPAKKYKDVKNHFLADKRRKKYEKDRFIAVMPCADALACDVYVVRRTELGKQRLVCKPRHVPTYGNGNRSYITRYLHDGRQTNHKM